MRRVWSLTAAAVVAMTAVLPMRGDDFMYEKVYYVRVGDAAPEVQCRDEAGKLWRSKDHFGKKYVVLVFYSGDFVPDCTKRLSGYRDYQSHLASVGAEIVAISGDKPENHELFRKAQRLNFTMLADTKAAMAQEFGVYASSGGITKTKDIDGREKRLQREATLADWTWVVARDGTVIYKDMHPNAATDSRKVYELLYRRATERR
jgi:peroxiredoxin Q/BCP